MRFQVHGVRTEIVSVYVDADSAEEAVELANDYGWDTSEGMDVWDIDDVSQAANPQY